MLEKNLRKGSPQAGDVASDLKLPGVDGKVLSLGDCVENGRNVLLIFLRHLG